MSQPADSTVVDRLPVVSATDILSQHWPEPPWAIQGLLPTGLTILAGRPKVGKSWLALQFALAVAGGTDALGFRAQAGPVLYLALEDPPRRLHARMRKQNWPAFTSTSSPSATSSPKWVTFAMAGARNWPATSRRTAIDSS